MNRRGYLKNITLIAGGMVVSNDILGKLLSIPKKEKTILLCTGVQYANIGDGSHVTGILNLLNTFLPEVKIILWPVINVNEFDEMILRNWPDIEIVHADFVDGMPNNSNIGNIAGNIDFIIGGHGQTDKVQWAAATYGKPYGIIGVSVGSPPKGSFKDFVDEAEFYFTRETGSYENLKNADVKCEVYGFAPDASFGSNVQDTYRAITFMKEHGLEYKKFLCVVPRLRVTPYYLIAPSLKHSQAPWSQERIREVDELNNKHKEEDHAKARAAIVTYIRRTGNPVLLCPEMVHNMELFDELLYNPLPDAIKKKVIKRTSFWRTDEATTVYKNATAVISLECHSPIIALTQGTPAFYLRQPEDTIKGQMYYDIGLSDWVFEIENTKAQDIVDRLMDVVNDYRNACEKLELSMDYVRDLQRKCMSHIRKAVGLVTIAGSVSSQK